MKWFSRGAADLRAHHEEEFMLHHVWRPAAAAAGLAFVAGLAFGGTAQAESVQKQCSAKYQAAKSSNSLNGETWNQFYKQCATELKGGSAAAPAQTSAPASAPPPATTTTQVAPAPKKHHWWQGGGSSNSAGAPSAPPPMAAGNVVFPSAVSPQYSSLSAGRARMETCVAQYRANKANGGNGNLKWIEKGGGYWSECNRHLKGM
jgi:hypothetical protein